MSAEQCGVAQEKLAIIRSLKSRFEEAYAKVKEGGDTRHALDLKKQIELVVGELRDSLHVDEKRAEEIMGKENVLGLEAVRTFFDVRAHPFILDRIPFKTWELKRARELGQQLIYYTDTLGEYRTVGISGQRVVTEPLTLENLKQSFPKTRGGGPMFRDQNWYAKKDFFTNERPRTGWRLTSKEVIPGSYNKYYLEETEGLIEHLSEKVFADKKMPKEYEEAISEFHNERPNISRLLRGGKQDEVVKMFSGLKITRLTRELPVETMYRLILNDCVGNPNLLSSTWTRTGTFDDSSAIFVGSPAKEGATFNGNGVDERMELVGTSFSRGNIKFV